MRHLEFTFKNVFNGLNYTVKNIVQKEFSEFHKM